jgi:hypothetical protein
MNNNKQSSVEWLDKQLASLNFDYITGQVSNKEYNDKSKQILKQAKAMHKKEMVMFVLNVMGKYRNGDVLAEVATEFYEQTYGGGEQ